MNELTIALMIMFLCGVLPCVVFGYLIAVKQKHHLISGWDESKVSDPKAYGILVGGSVLILGVLIGVIAVAWFFEVFDDINMTIALFISSLIPVICVIIASKKYSKPGD